MRSGLPKAPVPRWSTARVWLACWCWPTSYFTAAHLSKGGGVIVFPSNEIEPLKTWECPRNCEDLFDKLTYTSESKRKIQEVNITERGEPKSGTGFMMGKATEALAHFCHYLQRAYGQRSCRIEKTIEVHRNLIFEPQLGGDDGAAPCSCDSLDRVNINFSASSKHSFPVDTEKCPWSHPGGTLIPDNIVCKTAGRTGEPEDRNALWDCVRKAPCPITDDSQQMAVLRDPREVAVSTFYFWTRRRPMKLERFDSIDSFFLAFLPAVCKWLSVRFLLFEELFRDQSSVFWYDDAVSNPARWYSHFFSFAGINVPPAVLDETVHAHDEGGNDLGFHEQKLDDHPNGSISRSYKDEISAEAVEVVDDILRKWLPPAFLDRIGVSN